MQKQISKSRGFTLIELLVVIAIIGLLASVILASLNTARAKARDARRIHDLHEIQLALEMYYDANQSYPDEAGWCDSSKNVTQTNCATYGGDKWPAGGLVGVQEQGFIAKLPIDPINSNQYYYQYEPVCHQEQFGVTCKPGKCCSYRLGAVLENTHNAHYSPGCLLGTAINYCVQP